jgi:hypothetical protein
MRRQLCELGRNLIERQTDPLCKNNERDPAQDSPLIAALTAAGPV